MSDSSVTDLLAHGALTEPILYETSGRFDALLGLRENGASLVAALVLRGVEGRALAATGPVTDALPAEVRRCPRWGMPPFSEVCFTLCRQGAICVVPSR